MSSGPDSEDFLDKSWVFERRDKDKLDFISASKLQSAALEDEDALDSDLSSEPDDDERRGHSIASSTATVPNLTPTKSISTSSEPELIMPSSQSWISPAPTSMSSSRQRSSVSESYSRTRLERKIFESVQSDSTRQANVNTSKAQLADGPRDQWELSSGLNIDYTSLLRQKLSSFSPTTIAITRPLAVVILTLWVTAIIGRLNVPTAILPRFLPICRVPGVQSLNISLCALALPLAQPDFGQLMKVQSSFEDVLTSSISTANLPQAMKEGEASIRDLKVVVEHSDLSSRNELIFEFSEFINTARRASFDLTRFNAHIGRTVDAVLSINRWTLRVVEGISDDKASQSAVSRFLQYTILAPFQAVRITESLLLDQYLRHTEKVEEQIARLILEAQGLLIILQSLDDQLDIIQSISAREGIAVQNSRDDLLAQLWSRLGGNRSSKKKLQDQTRLLRLVDAYRRTAWDHVNHTILKLQAISAGLEDLREQVAAPDVVSQARIPLQVHVEMIQMSLERLGEHRFGAKEWQNEKYKRMMHSEVSGHIDEKHAYIEGKEKS